MPRSVYQHEQDMGQGVQQLDGEGAISFAGQRQASRPEGAIHLAPGDLGAVSQLYDTRQQDSSRQRSLPSPKLPPLPDYQTLPILHPVRPRRPTLQPSVRPTLPLLLGRSGSFLKIASLPLPAGAGGIIRDRTPSPLALARATLSPDDCQREAYFDIPLSPTLSNTTRSGESDVNSSLWEEAGIYERVVNRKSQWNHSADPGRVTVGVLYSPRTATNLSFPAPPSRQSSPVPPFRNGQALHHPNSDQASAISDPETPLLAESLEYRNLSAILFPPPTPLARPLSNLSTSPQQIPYRNSTSTSVSSRTPRRIIPAAVFSPPNVPPPQMPRFVSIFFETNDAPRFELGNPPTTGFKTRQGGDADLKQAMAPRPVLEPVDAGMFEVDDELVSARPRNRPPPEYEGIDQWASGLGTTERRKEIKSMWSDSARDSTSSPTAAKRQALKRLVEGEHARFLDSKGEHDSAASTQTWLSKLACEAKPARPSTSSWIKSKRGIYTYAIPSFSPDLLSKLTQKMTAK